MPSLKGLDSIFRLTQHSACGSVLGQALSRLRRWIFGWQIPLANANLGSDAWQATPKQVSSRHGGPWATNTQRNNCGTLFRLKDFLQGALSIFKVERIEEDERARQQRRDPKVRLPTAGSCPLTCFSLKSPQRNLPSKPKLLGLENSAPTRNCIGSFRITRVAKTPKFLLTRNSLGVGYVQSGIKWDAVVRRLALVGASCSKWFHRPKRHATGS